MAETATQPTIDPDYRYESRARTNSSGTAASTPSSSSDYITGEADDSSESKATVPFTLKSVEALLCISKAASPDDLQEMVEKCKRMVLESAECSEERKWLVRRLIELRLRAQELRETAGDNVMETQVMLGHHLVPQKYYIATSSPTYCDHCSGAIWTMLQSWYMCRDCGFCSHWKCINDIRRVCAHVVASETGGYTYTTDICPEKGLSAQGYRCAECHTRITFKSAWVEPRLCDYSGLFYCQRCHWNSMAVIPARVVRNWDMEPRKVCRSAAQLLTLLEERPVLSLEALNPKLFSLIPDLTLIKFEEILTYKIVEYIIAEYKGADSPHETFMTLLLKFDALINGYNLDVCVLVVYPVTMDLFHHRYYRTNKIFMTIIGQWPFQTTRSSRRLLAILLFLCITQTVPQVIALVKYYDNKVLFLQCAGPLLFAFATFTKIICCICYSRQMADMLNCIRTHWKMWAEDEEVEILHKYAEQGRKITIMYAVVIFLTGVVFITQPIIPTIIGVFLRNHSEPGVFPFAVDYYNLDMEKYYFYIIIYTYICVSASLLVTIASDTMFIVYIHHGCGIFSAVGHKVQHIQKRKKSMKIGKNVLEFNEKDMIFDQLSLCVDRHNDAIEYAELLAATYSWYFFFIMGYAMIAISLAGLQVADNKNDKRDMPRHVVAISANMIHLYVDNYLSQMLMDHSISIRYYIHNGKWYNLSLKNQRLLGFMMMRCNMPCKLTAGKFTVMSVKTFAVILKTSLSYFTLLRSI